MNSKKSASKSKDRGKGAGLGRDMRLKLYAEMVRIRKFEEGINMVYKQALMPGLAHLYIGMEAVAVGVCNTLKTDDQILSTHRGHGHLVAKGADLKRMMAEVLGKRDGYCKGKGGSMHIAAHEMGILGANGIVGAGVPIACGAGLTSKLLKLDKVVVCFFGDSASNIGAFHEGINMASVYNVPVVYVCENNLYGISVAQSRHQKIKNIADRAAAYAIPGEVMDGNDVEDVYTKTRKYVQAARAGKGPALLEAKTYRTVGHHVGDPGTKYRSQEEIDSWKARDPIAILEKKLLDSRQATKKEIEKINDDIQKLVDEAIEFAKNSPYPDPLEATEDILINPNG